ncbi:single-stranded DNA-binding protein [Candidatus Dojkabacteria bacterium]|nr:single-stranded DNA-binding protein [Candidatus Dojkabacteria bacterium]
MRANQYAIVKGRLTSDAEVNTSDTGKSYIRVGLAVNNKRKNKEGKEEEIATFYNIVCFDKMAEIYGNLEKGDFVRAEGRLEVSPYLSSKKKEPKVDLTIIANEIMRSDYVGGEK